MSLKNIFFIFILIWIALSCDNKIKDLQPVSDFEKSRDPLPAFQFSITASRSQVISFDSIAQGGNFTISFTPLLHGRISNLSDGKSILLTLDASNWKKDSTEYTIMKNSVARTGTIVLFNSLFRPDTLVPEPVDTACSALPDKKLFLDFNTLTTIVDLFPDTFQGNVDSFSAAIYSVSIMTGNGRLSYLANPASQDQNWAFDTVWYKLKARNRKCFTGKVLITLGDTCEPQAREDVVPVPSGSLIFPETLLTQNDKGCNNSLGSYITRTAKDFDYGNYKVMNTNNGVLTDTLINGSQHYKYVKTVTSATDDLFEYYFKNLNSGRVTKAKVKLSF